MTIECVFDAELLKKYSSDNKCASYLHVAQNLLNAGHDKFIIRECNCLFEFFTTVTTKNKCVICYNEKINTEYSNLIDKLPDDLMLMFSNILSNKCAENRDGSFIFEDFEELNSTQLEHKTMYLDVAKSLINRIIISTKEDVDTIYNPNISILTKHAISCKSVCEYWDILKQD